MGIPLALILLYVTTPIINCKKLKSENKQSFTPPPKTFRAFHGDTEQLQLDEILKEPLNHGASKYASASEPPPGRRASEPPPGRRASEPPPGRRASEPPPGRRASEPPPGRRASEPPPGRRASEPPPGRRASEPLPGRRASEPLPGRRASEPLPGRRASEPPPGRRASEPPPGWRASEPPPGRRASEPLPGRRASEPPPGRRASEPPPGRRTSEPPPGRKASEALSGQRASEPTSGWKASEALSGQRASEPTSGRKASELISGHDHSKPTSNLNHNLDLNTSKFIVNNSTLSYFASFTSTKLIPAMYIIVILIGIPSNALVLKMLLSRDRTLCTAIFYTNLAISDLLFCLLLPFRVAYHLNGNHWIFGEAMCRIMTIFFYGNMYCSILLLMCISISRYIAVIHPFVYRSLPKRLCTILMCALVWITVLVFMIPFFLNKQTYNLQKPPLVTCNDIYEVSADAFQFFYFISMAVFGYLIPFSVVTFCYFSIIRALGVGHKKWCLYLKITILNLVIFTVCFTPSNIILIIHQVRYYYTKMDDMYGSYLIALCFSSFNSCLDPFLYFLMPQITKPSKAYAKINKLSHETHITLPVAEAQGST